MPRIPIIDRTREQDDGDPPALEAASGFADSIRGVHEALREGDCQEAADRFGDAGDWFADVVRFRQEGHYDATLMMLWEERYKGAYEQLAEACELVSEDLNGPSRCCR